MVDENPSPPLSPHRRNSGAGSYPISQAVPVTFTTNTKYTSTAALDVALSDPVTATHTTRDNGVDDDAMSVATFGQPSGWARFGADNGKKLFPDRQPMTKNNVMPLVCDPRGIAAAPDLMVGKAKTARPGPVGKLRKELDPDDTASEIGRKISAERVLHKKFDVLHKVKPVEDQSETAKLQKALAGKSLPKVNTSPRRAVPSGRRSVDDANNAAARLADFHIPNEEKVSEYLHTMKGESRKIVQVQALMQQVVPVVIPGGSSSTAATGLVSRDVGGADGSERGSARKGHAIPKPPPFWARQAPLPTADEIRKAEGPLSARRPPLRPPAHSPRRGTPTGRGASPANSPRTRANGATSPRNTNAPPSNGKPGGASLRQGWKEQYKLLREAIYDERREATRVWDEVATLLEERR